MVIIVRQVAARQAVRPRLAKVGSRVTTVLARPLVAVPRPVSERLQHPIPYPLQDTLSDFNWEDYEQRYAAVHRSKQSQRFLVRDVIKQRRHEKRYNWGSILLQTFRTSPIAVTASLKHMIFAACLATPYELYQWRGELEQLLTADVYTSIVPYLTHPTFTTAMGYFDAHQGTLLAAFSVYSTALFLLLSLRLNSAVKFHADGVQAFTELCTQVSCFTHLSQLYMTDKRIATEATLWAYAVSRATEAQMHRVSGEEAREMYEHLLLAHASQASTAAAVCGGAAATEGEPAAADGAAAGERDAPLRFILGGREQRARVEGLILAPNQPVYLMQQLTAMLRVAFDRGVVTNIRALIAVHSTVERMQHAHAACQRVQRSPEPSSYTTLMKISSALWTAGIPFVMLPTLHAAAVPMCALLVFFVTKIDEISAELQNPFGYDISDIGMGTISRRLQGEIAQSMLVYNHQETAMGGQASFPWGVSGVGNAQDATIEAMQPGTLKLGLAGVGDWKDNEKLCKAAGLGGRTAVFVWPTSP